MSSVITIDAAQLHKAVPGVTELHARLLKTAVALGGLDMSVEMPPGVRGRVAGLVDAAREDLRTAADSVDGMGAEIARRAGLADAADKLGTLSKVTGPLAYQLDAIANYSRNAAKRAALRGNLNGARINRKYQLGAEKLAGRLKAASKAVGLVPGAVADIRNPYISTERKIGKVAVSVGTDQALGMATKALASRLPLAAAGPAGLAIGVAWMVADSKFHLTDKAVDLATLGVDKAEDGIDKVTPWDGVAPW